MRSLNLYEFGGTEETVKRVQSRYVKYFRDSSPVLDIGCGRSVFLELLASAGIQAVGIDSSEEAVAYSREKGFAVESGDVLAFLAQSPPRFGGIFCSHVIEHMEYQQAMELLSLCHRALRPGGTLLLLTPNPQDIGVISEVFWLDPTHVRPYPKQLLQSMLKNNGFQITEAKQFLPSWRLVGRRNLPIYVLRRILLGRHYGRPDTFILAKAQ